MDAEQLIYLTPDQQDRWRKLEETFMTDGWKLIEEWAKVEEEKETQRAALSSSWENNRISVGQRIVYARIQTLANATEAEFAALADQAKEEQLLEDELEFE